MRAETSPAPKDVTREARRCGEGVDYVTCRLCRRRFKAIVNKHLVKVHGFGARRPLAQYRGAYPSSETWCRRTRRALSAALVRYAQRQPKACTESQVAERIRQLRKSGATLGARSVARNYPRILRGAVRHFGSWPRALEACGVDPASIRQHRRWTPRSVIRAIRLRRRRGGSLAYRTVHLEDTGLVKAAVRSFGTWDLALSAAGIDAGHVRRIRAWDPDKILRAIRAGARKMPPGKLRLRDKGLFATASAYFGGWPMALEVANVAPRVRWHPPSWSRGEVIREIRARVRGGGSLAWRALFRKNPELIGAALGAFGSWRAAVTAAGYRVSRPMTRQEWTRPELSRLLVELQKRHGRVTPELLRRARPEGYASPSIHAGLLFGSLEKAIREILHRGAHRS